MDNFLGVMKALSDENRLKIIDILMHHDYCVGAISKCLDISEAAVSQHLKVLRKANIVTGEKRGYYTHYEINSSLLDELSEELHLLATTKTDRRECTQNLPASHTACKNNILKEQEKQKNP